MVGVEVSPQPTQLTTTKWSVSGVSVEEQVLPCTKTPPRHSSRTCCGACRTEPVRSAPAGFKIMWSANRVTSNPLRPSEFWMNTETRSWVPAAPLSGAGLEGQVVVPGEIKQTTPVNWPWAAGFTATIPSMDPISSVIENRIAVFFERLIRFFTISFIHEA